MTHPRINSNITNSDYEFVGPLPPEEQTRPKHRTMLQKASDAVAEKFDDAGEAYDELQTFVGEQLVGKLPDTAKYALGVHTSVEDLEVGSSLVGEFRGEVSVHAGAGGSVSAQVGYDIKRTGPESYEITLRSDNGGAIGIGAESMDEGITADLTSARNVEVKLSVTGPNAARELDSIRPKLSLPQFPDLPDSARVESIAGDFGQGAQLGVFGGSISSTGATTFGYQRGENGAWQPKSGMKFEAKIGLSTPSVTLGSADDYAAFMRNSNTALSGLPDEFYDAVGNEMLRETAKLTNNQVGINAEASVTVELEQRDVFDQVGVKATFEVAIGQRSVKAFLSADVDTSVLEGAPEFAEYLVDGEIEKAVKLAEELGVDLECEIALSEFDGAEFDAKALRAKHGVSSERLLMQIPM